ncbi:MAG: hypothetical protein WA892_05375 [Ornithinimicrobium sp.]
MEGAVITGILLPDAVVYSKPFAVLMAFVAINTIMYTVLAVAKTLPKVHLADYLPRRRFRAETRSIYPDAPP